MVAYQNVLLPKCTVNFKKTIEKMNPLAMFILLFFRVGNKIDVFGGHMTILQGNRRGVTGSISEHQAFSFFNSITPNMFKSNSIISLELCLYNMPEKMPNCSV